MPFVHPAAGGCTPRSGIPSPSRPSAPRPVAIRSAWRATAVTLAVAGALLATQRSAQAGQRIDVPNTTANTVSVVDADSGTVLKTIPVKGLPFIAAPLTNGRKVCIDNLGTSVSGVSVIDTATDAVKTINLGFPPFSVVLSPDQTRLYAVKVTSGLTSGIDVIDTRTDQVIQRYVPGGTIAPIGLQVSPAGKLLYLSYPSGTVAAVDAATGKTVRSPTYFGGLLPTWLSLSRDGRLLYHLNWFSGDTLVIDTATWKEVGSIKTQGRPLGIAIAADGSGYYSDWGAKSAKALQPPLGTSAAWVVTFLAGKGSLDALGAGQLVHFDTHTHQPLANPTPVGITPNILEIGPDP